MISGALSEHCRGGWGRLAYFGHDSRSSDSWRAKRIFFCQVSNAWFHRFPIGQISRNLNTTRRSVRQWKLSKQKFENFNVRVFFSKNAKRFTKFQRLATSCRHNCAIITDRRKFTTKWSSMHRRQFHGARRALTASPNISATGLMQWTPPIIGRKSA